MKNMQSLIGKTIVKIKVIDDYTELVILFYTSDNEVSDLTINTDMYSGGDWEFKKLTVDNLKSWDNEEWYIKAISRGFVKVYE